MAAATCLRLQMVAVVHAAAPDAALLRRALAALQQEHAYWSSGAKQVVLTSASGVTHSLSRYWAAWDQPRPESYRCAWPGLTLGQPMRAWQPQMVHPNRSSSAC
jgi:neutral trehalase